ncbi:MAG: SURF1 family cytochrome oxidase biogenesis protein [Nocardioidaceae bacterium]
MRFLFTRRWLLFAVAVAAAAYACYLLGQWQFHRLHDRKIENATIERNERATPVPIEKVAAVGRPVATTDEWRRVTATGTYLQDRTVIIRYQTRDGGSGVDVVTPLRTANGTSVLVDRGWMSSGNTGARPHVPAAPQAPVTVTGWLRVNADGGSATVTDRSARAISSAQIGPTVGTPVYGGFVDAQRESPAPATKLVPAELPDLSNGPHFFYGLQWWFFGVLAVFGFFYLAYDERRKTAQSERSMPPSTGSITPVTNDAAGDSRKAAARPNSSGRP